MQIIATAHARLFCMYFSSLNLCLQSGTALLHALSVCCTARFLNSERDAAVSLSSVRASVETTDRFGSSTLVIDSPTARAVSTGETYVVNETHFDGIVERRTKTVVFMQEVVELEPCPWE